jgi:hypothetical protein
LDCRHVCKTWAFHDALQARKKKEDHRTPLILRLRAPDQGITVGELLSVSRLKNIMKGPRFRDVAAIQERVKQFCDRFLNRPLLTVSRSFMNVANSVL